MGYQEAFRAIIHLAEAVGVRRAIEDYRHHPDLSEHCTYCCASRKRRSYNLFVRIGGQQNQLHYLADIDFEDCVPYYGIYDDYFEDIDEALVDEAARERPDLVEKGYRECATDFEHVVKKVREQRQEREIAVKALKPSIDAFLKENGPSTKQELYAIRQSEEHSIDDALDELIFQGLLMGKYNRGKNRYWFADEAVAGSYKDAVACAPSIEDKVERALARKGTSSVRDLTFSVDVSDASIRKALQRLIEQNIAVVDKTGSVQMFSLADIDQESAVPA